MEYCCENYNTVLKIFEKMYALRPDTATMFKSAGKLYLSVRIDDTSILMEYKTDSKKIEVEFKNGWDERDADESLCEDEEVYAPITLDQFRIMNVLVGEFSKIFEKFTEGEGDE